MVVAYFYRRKVGQSGICVFVFVFLLSFCHLIAVVAWLVTFEIGCGVGRYLNEPEVVRAVQMLEDGATQRTVAERLGVSCSVVARLWI